MKTFFITLSAIIVSIFAFQVFTSSQQSDDLDEWGQQTLALFKDTAQFFSSFGDKSQPDNILDDELKALLPSDTVELRFEPQLDETLEIANGQPADISPEALLPNLFEAQEKTGTSVKGELFTDKEDKIIGAKVQVAIPTDM